MTWYDEDENEDEVFEREAFSQDASERQIRMECSVCHFTVWDDAVLMSHHSCEIQQQGGTCEDYPCCGHERGDCNGLRYGSDEKIKADVYRAMRDPDFAYMMERQMEYDSYWG